MNILFVGDIHHKITRFQLGIDCLSWVSSVIDDKKPDMVVFLGDLFDNHSILRSEIMGEYRKFLDKVLLNHDIKIYHVLGNHEYFKPADSKYHALQGMKGFHENFIVVDERMDVGDITLVPFIPDPKEFPVDTKSICIAHQTFIGADYGYTRPDAGVDANIVNAEIIISGHVHIRQEFGKVFYPGSAYSQSVTDINQSKGILLFCTDTFRKEMIWSPLPKWMGYKYEISDKFTIDNLYNEMKSVIDPMHHWIFEVSGPKAEILSYMASRKYKNLIKDVDVKIKPKFTDRDKKLVTIEALSMEHIVSEWVNKVYDGSLNKDSISSKAIDILNKVRQSGAKHKM